MYKENKKTSSEKYLRQKYIRVIEKFVKRIINMLKSNDFDFDTYKEKTLEYYKEVQDVEKIRLNNNYLSQLESYCNHILNTLENHSKDFKEEKEFLLKEANLLHKEKNKSNYKKEKHKHKSFNDGY